MVARSLVKTVVSRFVLMDLNAAPTAVLILTGFVHDYLVFFILFTRSQDLKSVLKLKEIDFYLFYVLSFKTMKIPVNRNRKKLTVSAP